MSAKKKIILLLFVITIIISSLGIFLHSKKNHKSSGSSGSDNDIKELADFRYRKDYYKALFVIRICHFLMAVGKKDEYCSNNDNILEAKKYIRDFEKKLLNLKDDVEIVTHDGYKFNLKKEIENRRNEIENFFFFAKRLVQNKNKLSHDVFIWLEENFYQLLLLYHEKNINIAFSFYETNNETLKKNKMLNLALDLILLPKINDLDEEVKIPNLIQNIDITESFSTENFFNNNEKLKSQKLKNNFVSFMKKIKDVNFVTAKKFFCLVGLSLENQEIVISAVAKILKRPLIKTQIFSDCSDFNKCDLAYLLQAIKKTQVKNPVIFLNLPPNNTYKYLNSFFDHLRSNITLYQYVFDNAMFIFNFPFSDVFKKIRYQLFEKGTGDELQNLLLRIIVNN